MKSEGLLPTLGEPQKTVQSAIDAYNRHDAAGFLTQYAPDVKTLSPTLDSPVQGSEALRRALPQEWKAFPDAHLQVKSFLATGERVAVETLWTGTYRRRLPGFPAARGQRIRLEQMTLYSVKNGRISELHSFYDPGSLTRQLEGGQPIRVVVPSSQPASTAIKNPVRAYRARSYRRSRSNRPRPTPAKAPRRTPRFKTWSSYLYYRTHRGMRPKTLSPPKPMPTVSRPASTPKPVPARKPVPTKPKAAPRPLTRR